MIKEVRDIAYEDYEIRGRLGASLVEDGDGILTICFAETAFILAMAFAKQEGKTIYPAFDITPPYMVSGVITRYGILSPYDLKNHFKQNG